MFSSLQTSVTISEILIISAIILISSRGAEAREGTLLKRLYKDFNYIRTVIIIINFSDEKALHYHCIKEES